jgi:hypothetical protein
VSDRALRRRAALHEAGHVVVALEAGIEIEYVLLDATLPSAWDEAGAWHHGPGNAFTVYVPPTWFSDGFLRPDHPWPPLASLGEEQRSYLFRRIATSIAGELV